MIQKLNKILSVLLIYPLCQFCLDGIRPPSVGWEWETVTSENRQE